MSISNTPQAKDDVGAAGEDRLLTLDVMGNDLGGAAKHLYSVDQADPLHVLTTSVSRLGATISIVDGKIVYDSSHAGTLQALAAGETATDTFTYVIQLGNGTLSTATVTILVTGSNDAPVLSADVTAAHALTELVGATGASTSDTASATLAFTDVDLSDTHSVSIGAPSAVWSNGTPPAATVAALLTALSSTLADSTHTGAGAVALVLSAADKAFDFLGIGETLTVTYDVSVTDNNGAISTKPVTFVVTGTNDGPVLAADAGHALTETAGATGASAADTASATLAFTDVDLSDTHSVTIGAPSAVWSNGTPPAATVAALQTALSSTLTDSTHTGAGSVALVLSAADKAFDFLGVGETLTVTYDVSVTDNHGAVSTKPVTFVITGTNDTPVLVADAGHGLTEAAGATGSNAADAVSTTLAFTDVDLTDHHTASVAAPTMVWSGGADLPAGLATALGGALSTSVVDSTGSGAGAVQASFAAPDSAFDFLAAGETLTVTYTVSVDDGHGGVSSQPVTITVTGSNDAPVLTADAVATHAISEASGQTGSSAADTASATLSFADVDLSDTHSVSIGAPSAVWSNGTPPAATVAALQTALTSTLADSTHTGAGSVALVLSAADKAFDFLGVGETLTVTYNVSVTDNNGAVSTKPVTFVITGTNDAPVVTDGATVSGAITEDASPSGVETASGAFAFADADLSDHHTVSWSLASSTASQVYGSLNAVMGVDGNGAGTVSWTYTANDSALQALASGETVTETYTVSVDDGHGGTVAETVVVTLTGANDAPVVSGPVTGSAIEGGAAIGLNALAHAQDVDHGAILQVVDLPGSLPAGVSYDVATHTFSLDPANTAYDHLSGGATQVVSVSYGVSDGMATTPTTVSWTITGTNDAPVVSGAVTGNATEGGAAVRLDALANAHDVDDGAVLTTSLTTSLPAGVSYDAVNHAFSLDPTNHAFDHLAVGETQTVVVNYLVSDGQVSVPASATWTVIGTNDAPVLAPAQTPELLVNGDFDQGGPAGWSNTAGGIEVNGGGVYGVSGYAGNVMELDVNNTHDDVSQTVATSAGTAYTFAFDVAQRAGTSAASNTFQVLWNGQVIDTITPGSTAMEHHSYTVAGTGASGTVEFVETGTNDSYGTIIDNVSLKASGVQEQAGLTGSSAVDAYSASLTFSDLDTHDTHTASATLQSLTVSGGGALPSSLAADLGNALATSLTESNGTGVVGANFHAADNLFDFLQAGQTLSVTYSVAVSDGHGGTATQPVTVTVTGTNDAPVVSQPIADVQADMLHAFSFTPSASTFTDVDNSSLSWTATKGDGSALPSWLHFDTATHSFSGTPAGADVGELDVKVTASDGTLSASDTFHLTVNIVNQVLTGTSNGEQLTGDVGADTLSGNAGNDTLVGGAGNDVVYGDATGAQGAAPTASFALSAVALADLSHGNTLVAPAAGTTSTLAGGDDNSSSPIDITSVFGSQGLNFFGNHFTNLFVNNNGNLTFGAANFSYTPSSIAAGSTPIIAPFWADVMTGFSGGGSVTYNLDATNGVFTATWDHVGYYYNHGSPTDTFQLQLINEGGGNFDIVFRYQQIGWTTGDASGGSGGLGGSVARAGFNSGTGTEFEIPQSANQANMLALPTESNVGIDGVFVFHVRNGVVSAANSDIVDGGAGTDTLTGGSGADTFVFHVGEANGDVVTDFNPGDGDKVLLVGYGAGATFTQVDATHWEVNYGASQHEVISFLQAPPIQAPDYSWAGSFAF